MSNIYIFVYVFYCMLVLPEVSGRGHYTQSHWCSACDPADPIPLRRIDINKIKGVWKCRYLRIPKGFPAKDVPTSLNIVIDTPLSNGSIPFTLVGRSTVNCECDTTPYFLNFVGDKNAYKLLPRFATNSSVDVEWRFVDAFGQYLIALECGEFDGNRRCLRSFVDVFSRTNDEIPLEDLKLINKSLRKTVCLDLFDDLIEWASGNDCPLPTSTTV